MIYVKLACFNAKEKAGAPAKTNSIILNREEMVSQGSSLKPLASFHTEQFDIKFSTVG